MSWILTSLQMTLNPIIKCCSWFYCILGLLNVSLSSFCCARQFHSIPFLHFHSFIRTYSLSQHQFHFMLYPKIDKFCLFHFIAEPITTTTKQQQPTKIEDTQTHMEQNMVLGMPASMQLWMGSISVRAAETIAICQNNQFIIAAAAAAAAASEHGRACFHNQKYGRCHRNLAFNLQVTP